MSLVTVRRLARLLMAVSAASLCALAEEPKLVSIFVSKNAAKKNMERTLQSLREKVPEAVKMVEFHDESRSFFLLKLSNNSYGVLEDSVGSYTWKVTNAENGERVSEKVAKRHAGNFKYMFVDDTSGHLIQTTFTWVIDEKELDIGQPKHLVFEWAFSEGKGRTAKTVSIAVDWEKGRADAVKVVPLKGP